jgi:hypothetical protein
MLFKYPLCLQVKVRRSKETPSYLHPAAGKESSVHLRGGLAPQRRAIDLLYLTAGESGNE